MLKRIGNVTVANAGINVGVYVNHTPYRTSFFGVNVFGRWQVGRSRTPGVQAFALGPFVAGRYNLADVGKRTA